MILSILGYRLKSFANKINVNDFSVLILSLSVSAVSCQTLSLYYSDSDVQESVLSVLAMSVVAYANQLRAWYIPNSFREEGKAPLCTARLRQPFITEQTAEEEDGNARQRLEKDLLHRILRMQVDMRE